VDVVSKNGNLLLSVPVKGDGSIDPTERRIVGEIGEWMAVNSESIYETRPWSVYGEGPTADNANPIKEQGFNEGKQKYSAADIRFNKKGDKTLYVTLFDIPSGDVQVKSLGKKSGYVSRRIKSVRLLGSDQKLEWSQGDDSLVLSGVDYSEIVRVPVFKVEFR
jgi:alpha-L-fucosidase